MKDMENLPVLRAIVKEVVSCSHWFISPSQNPNLQVHQPSIRNSPRLHERLCVQRILHLPGSTVHSGKPFSTIWILLFPRGYLSILHLATCILLHTPYFLS
jgi:hypothetical protein